MDKDKRKRKRKIFYGWWIVVASTLAYTLFGGVYFYGFSTFFMPLVQEFGWSRAATSVAFSLSRMESGLLGPISGILVDRFGPRKMMLLGVILMGAGFILLSKINSLFTFYIVFVLGVAMGGTTGIQQATTVAVANWFNKKRGTALGIAHSGMGLSGVLVPVIAWLIIQYGWRQTAVITGIGSWVIGIPLALFMRHRPERYGSSPDGEPVLKPASREQITRTAHNTPSSSITEKAATAEIDFTPGQATRTPVFWVLTMVFGLRQFVIAAIVIHQIPFLTGLGISPALAATMLGSLALISIVGRLGFGWLADKWDKRFVNAICLGSMAAGCFILAGAQSMWSLILFLIVYSPGYGGGGVLMNAIRADYFGRQHFGTIMGLMNLFQMFGLVLGPIFAGWVFDITGSYRLAFTVFGVAAGAASVLTLFARRPVLSKSSVK